MTPASPPGDGAPPGQLDETHDPGLRSWVESANVPGGDFPIQNLPLGVFRRRGAGAAAGAPGVAIGDRIVDLRALRARGLLSPRSAQAVDACADSTLNGLLALGREHARALRLDLSRLLRRGAPRRDETAAGLVAMDEADLLQPVRIGNFTDFYTSIHHASNARRLVRPDSPLLLNFTSLPVAYHGRASSVAVSGTPCRRPRGQARPAGATAASFGPSGALDFELELGLYVGPGNALGEPIPLGEAERHVAGLSLVNDWSARDIQRWEYQPLGPFLAKSFLTTVSPWVVTLDALAPFRVAAARAATDPPLLPYLDDPVDRAAGGLDITLEAYVESRRIREQGVAPLRLARAPFASQYWTIFQMLTHHASNGCNLGPGDLIATGTVSGPAAGEEGPRRRPHRLRRVPRPRRRPDKTSIARSRRWTDSARGRFRRYRVSS